MTLPHRIEAASGADRALGYDIAHLTGDHFRNGGKAPAYTANIDAALTLLDRSDTWHISGGPLGGYVSIESGDDRVPEFKSRGATPALALCAAALKAHIERNEG